MFLQNKCIDSGDDEKIKKLIEILQTQFDVVRSYGECLHTVDLPLLSETVIQGDDFCKVAGDYLFYMAIENQFAM